MSKAIAVIGAGHGDEGKGKMVSYFAKQADLVVRFNGGAQAGHTIQSDAGLKHICSHVGAGLFSGVPTFLSRFFIVNPILFNREYVSVASLTSPNLDPVHSAPTPIVFTDPECMVTTPFDMILNQAAELARGNGRHGSCGVGINETVTRHETPGFETPIGKMLDLPWAMSMLRNIKDFYVPNRAKELGVTLDPAVVDDPSLIYNFIHDLFFYSKRSAVIPPHMVVNTYAFASGRSTLKRIVFEGAQGLLLDQDHGQFPHVTRSNTGLKNVITLADEWGIPQVEAVYTTRSYVTKHGAGPLDGETDPTSLGIPLCQTNKPNLWQGTMRYAPLNMDNLMQAVNADFKRHARQRDTLKLAVTCADQLAVNEAAFDYISCGPGSGDVASHIN